MLLGLLTSLLAAISAGLTLWQWRLGRRFPLDRRVSPPSSTPGITLLKPLKGCDDETAACLRSWLDQRYAGSLQFLFGVADAQDPACQLVRDLLAAYPQLDAQLIICPLALGPNAKLSTLTQLQPRAQHPVLIVSDADVLVPPDLVGQLTAALQQDKTGLANCPYRLANPRTLALRWEAVAMNGDFWSQVLQSLALAPQDFALGAVMAVRRDALDQVGGFASLVDYLADDFELGHRLVAKGWRIALCPIVVDCREPVRHWPQVWQHQLRWARTIRVCRPAPYLASILSNATLWPLTALLTACCGSFYPARVLGLAALTLRLVAGTDLQHRFAPHTKPWRFAWMVPVKDLLSALIWLLSFAGNRVEWRGQRFRVGTDGRLQKL